MITFLEFTQILVNLTVTIAAIIVIIVSLMIGTSLLRLMRKIHESIERVRLEAVAVREHVSSFIEKISLVKVASKVNKWFNKKKKIINWSKVSSVNEALKYIIYIDSFPRWISSLRS